jgi:23S rRNA (cytidine1920-2'-O)/16S rRNA (cytidine1409-2'-O)-methyltransferase
VLVDGFPVTNPRSLVRVGAHIALREEGPLRGELKLRSALDAFNVPVTGRTALDVGAAAGGFTRELLRRGARRVYAVDAGHGQLLGSLAQDDRVVHLEATNLGDLSRELVPEAVGVVTIDVSYLSLALAVPQLANLEVERSADLVALVKPMFELGLGSLPPDDRLDEALAAATAGVSAAGWRVVAATESPIRGGRGARELFIHAQWQ